MDNRDNFIENKEEIKWKDVSDYLYYYFKDEIIN